MLSAGDLQHYNLITNSFTGMGKIDACSVGEPFWGSFFPVGLRRFPFSWPALFPTLLLELLACLRNLWCAACCASVSTQDYTASPQTKPKANQTAQSKPMQAQRYRNQNRSRPKASPTQPKANATQANANPTKAKANPKQTRLNPKRAPQQQNLDF